MPFKKIRYPCYNEQYKNTKEYERDNRKDERGYGLPSGWTRKGSRRKQVSCITRTQSNTRTRETRKRVPQTVYRRTQVVRQDTNTTVPTRPSSCGSLYFILTKYSATPPMDDRTSSSDRWNASPRVSSLARPDGSNGRGIYGSWSSRLRTYTCPASLSRI